MKEKQKKFPIEKLIFQEYEQYLCQKGLPGSPDNAYAFAIKKITQSANNHEYLGYKEMNIILLLEGRLPANYNKDL